MKRRLLVVLGVLMLSLGATLAADPPEMDQAAAPSSPATEVSDLTDGMLCVTEESTTIPEILEESAGRLALQGGVPDCPVNFSNCEDVPGRKCALQNCVTTSLPFDKCKKNGRIIRCRNGNLQQTTCDCLERLHLVCCDTDSCEFGECGFCSGGSLSTVCP